MCSVCACVCGVCVCVCVCVHMCVCVCVCVQCELCELHIVHIYTTDLVECGELGH